jgi:SapC
MATDTSSGQPPAMLSGKVMFYEQPEPLDPVLHANLGMNRTDRPYSFAAHSHFVPLHVGEFGFAAVCYPIIFAGPERMPMAVMGLQANSNLFISEDGLLRPGYYAPSFLRRYPFVGARDDQAGRVVVCIDRASSLWVEGKADVNLFENGEASEFTKTCIDFCGRFDADRTVTENFVKQLKDLDLLDPQQTMFTPNLPDGSQGEPQLVADYFAVSRDKLSALSVEQFESLRANGALTQIFAHLTSLHGWDKLLTETLAITSVAPVVANA